MSPIVPSPNAFPFASQEFALVGDTADARYPAFDISQPDTFIYDASMLTSTWLQPTHKKKQMSCNMRVLSP